MDVLLDTNILARAIEPAHPHHRPAHDAIAAIATRGDRLCLLPQVLYEYFVVCTRPQQEAGGMGMSNPDALAELRRVQALFHLLPDPPALYTTWLDLIERHAVMGKRAHDARLAAALIASSVPAILTFNSRDFRRYTGIVVLDPLQMTATPP
jgi:predicted nucleic acid-binding protein